MKKRLLLFVLLTSTAFSYSQFSMSNYKALINALGDGEKNTASELRAVFNAFAPSLYLKGDVKEIDCDNTYLALNFDNTGLGVNDRSGWAICNGLNGTRDRNGKVAIGYGSGYVTIGATGGSTDAILLEHDHLLFSPSSSATDINVGTNTYPVANSDGTGWGNELYRIRGGYTSPTLGKSSKTGVVGTNKNMQPYIVSLFIQKL